MAETSVYKQAVEAELEDVKEKAPKVEGVTLVAAVPETVRMNIWISETKNLTLLMMFPEKFPDQPVVVELKSKVLSDKLLDGLLKICEKQALDWVGQKQMVPMLKFVKTFIIENPLCVCCDEVSKIKKLLLTADDEIKLKQKTAEINLKIKQDAYFMNFKIGIPSEYPKKQVQIEIIENNFPDVLKMNFMGQAVEIARQCVQPPMKKNKKEPPFEPKPSLLPVSKHLVENCIKRYPQESCPICSEKVLPADPTRPNEDKRKRVERMYCGHLFHFGCLNKYLKTPPFAAGKFCAACGKQIFHDKWKISPELAEARWAHKQARQREIDEVADFLE